MRPGPFSLNGATATLSATTTSSEVTIAPASGVVRLYNAGTVPVFVRSGVGTQTAVTTDTALSPGGVEAFAIPTNHTRLAGITASGTATLYVQVGDGE